MVIKFKQSLLLNKRNNRELNSELLYNVHFLTYSERYTKKHLHKMCRCFINLITGFFRI